MVAGVSEMPARKKNVVPVPSSTKWASLREKTLAARQLLICNPYLGITSRLPVIRQEH